MAENPEMWLCFADEELRPKGDRQVNLRPKRGYANAHYEL